MQKDVYDKVKEYGVVATFTVVYVVLFCACIFCINKEADIAYPSACAFGHDVYGIATGSIGLTKDAVRVTGLCFLKTLLFIPAGLFVVVAAGILMTAFRTISRIFS